eukprot:scaffold281601_cov27-Tisochrysis_lutea.AAC.1
MCFSVCLCNVRGDHVRPPRSKQGEIASPPCLLFPIFSPGLARFTFHSHSRSLDIDSMVAASPGVPCRARCDCVE